MGELIEALAGKVGLVLLVLGAMHFGNLHLFTTPAARPPSAAGPPRAAAGGAADAAIPTVRCQYRPAYRGGARMTEVIAVAGSLSSKGERTRERILETALEHFREQGYDATTMRSIATTAGVSLGNSYYYFPSKDHLVQAFYWRMHVDRVAAVGDRLQGERDLLRRLRIVMRARLDVVAPHHAVSGTLFRTAADPASPLNPFSTSSSPTRRASIAFLREVVEGSDARLPRDVRPVLPHLLWLYELGLILFWVHDRSDRQRRSYELVEDTTEAIVRLLSLATLPGLRAIRRRLLHWVSDLIEEGNA